jgi:hypothetical protein
MVGLMTVVLAGHVLTALLATVHAFVIGVMAHLHLFMPLAHLHVLVMLLHRRRLRRSGLGGRHGSRCDQCHHLQYS